MAERGKNTTLSREGKDWTIDRWQISSYTGITSPSGQPSARLTLKEVKDGSNVRVDIPQNIQDLKAVIFSPEARFEKII
jgi:hypothetical protein